MTTDMLTAALEYAARGWRVVPILPQTKRPRLNEWQHAATTDPDAIHQWWGQGHDGIGIATGPGSGIFVLDVDVADDKRGDESLAELETLYGALPDTLEVHTGSGGRHLYFRWPDDAVVRNDAGRRLGPGLDVRGEGGQVVAPPTRHPNGNHYAWDLGCDEVADAPGWLIQLLTEDPWSTNASDATPDFPSEPSALLASTSFADRKANATSDGERGTTPAEHYNSLTTWPEILTADGWTLDHVDRSGEQHWVRPGKDARDGTSATVGWKGQDMLRVFTTSLPWLPERAYSRFGYHAARHYGGDRSAAARALRAAMTPERAPGPPSLALDAADTLDEHPDDDGVVELDDLLAEEDEPYDWLIEGLIERGDRVILTGQEGKGKSTLLRQFGLMAASGIHPFALDEIDPIRVLLVDLENSRRQIKRKIRPLRAQAGERYRQQFHLAARPDGLDLSRAVDVVWLERRIAAHRPDLVIIGPIYKMAMGDPKDEQAAKAVSSVLDHLRVTYGLALLIEAHTPYAPDGKTKRPDRPYGASLWSRWPEFGIFLDPDGDLRHWRGQRDERAWPTKLERSEPWPWMVAAGGATVLDDEPAWQGPTHCEDACVALLQRLGTELSVTKITEVLRAEGSGYRKGTVDAALRLADRKGLVTLRIGPRNALLYRYAGGAAARLEVHETHDDDDRFPPVPTGSREFPEPVDGGSGDQVPPGPGGVLTYPGNRWTWSTPIEEPVGPPGPTPPVPFDLPAF